METLENFYADERRRDSREVRFGTGWRSSKYDRFEFVVFWIAATEELCLLRASIRDVQSDGVFSRFIVGLPPHFNPRPLRDDEVAVEVLAQLTETDLRECLDGWERYLRDPGGIEWLRARCAKDPEVAPG